MRSGTAGGGSDVEHASGPQLLVLAGGEKVGESRRRARPGACRLNPRFGAVFVSRRKVGLRHGWRVGKIMTREAAVEVGAAHDTPPSVAL